MFELHDALLYAISICTLVSLAYLCLFALPASAAKGWTAFRETAGGPALPKLPAVDAPVQSLRYVRLTKRKEAPDDDSSPCTTLLMTTDANHQQGGFSRCPTRTRKSRYSMIISSRLSLG
ncbi:hypothetical protein I8J29_21890 [Paenibacillus sp. MWE-103]|uniref:Secreted protein n=1 Tax=Paenibacillus artemisiicola TaxID=1172618 RepID=A0ABS3WEY6_9BACL|nr:hypothetical protein [Paenibacillus artemisiicola]MBO7746873.1 hypothetical protein [Paenibacillus artemisiicola]